MTVLVDTSRRGSRPGAVEQLWFLGGGILLSLVSFECLFRRRGSLNSETVLLYSLSLEGAGRRAGAARGTGSFEAGRGMPDLAGADELVLSMSATGVVHDGGMLK